MNLGVYRSASHSVCVRVNGEWIALDALLNGVLCISLLVGVRDGQTVAGVAHPVVPVHGGSCSLGPSSSL